MLVRGLFLAVIFLFFAPQVFAGSADSSHIESDEVPLVIGAVISLKAQCLKSDDDECEEAVAVLNLLKRDLRNRSGATCNEKNCAMLLIDAMMEGIMEAAAQAK